VAVAAVLLAAQVAELRVTAAVCANLRRRNIRQTAMLCHALHSYQQYAHSSTFLTCKCMPSATSGWTPQLS
jgi:hypothetical protein